MSHSAFGPNLELSQQEIYRWTVYVIYSLQIFFAGNAALSVKHISVYIKVLHIRH